MDLTMGMLVNRRSHCLTHQRPATLDTSAPVTSMAANTSSTPRPGMLCRRSIAGPMDSGVTAATPDRKPPNTASIKPSSHSSTQIVMANGSQTIRPVSRYFLMGTGIPVLGQSQAVGLGVAAAGAALLPADAVVAAGAASVLAAGAAALSPVAGATLVDGALPPLKSVTYQPEPLS